MTRILPPLNALRAFEAAARNLSFKKAGDELNVTAAAISHQVKALEELLEVPLFYRMTRALQLTEAGREAFDKLEAGAEKIRAFCENDLLTISVSPSFGSMWLVPKLDRFRRKHPNIEIRIDGTDRLVDVASGDVDVAIRYGSGHYRGVQVDYLFNQFNTPVCSPKLLIGENALLHPNNLHHHTLLHIEWEDVEASWRMWLMAAGLHDIDPNRGPHFSQESMAVQAALDGHGVALIGDRLVADHLAAGRLVCPFGPDLKTPLTFSYYLLRSRNRINQIKITAFREWLIGEAQGYSIESN